MKKSCLKCKNSIESETDWHGLHHDCFREWFQLNQLLHFEDIAARSQSQIPRENGAINTSFFHGKFRKYSARLGDESYILKVEQIEYPELPATEYVSNQIFKSLKIPVPDHFLLRFPEERACFVTKNFMSKLSGSTLIHIYHFFGKGQIYDCETLIKIIGDLTGRRTEQEKFVYLTIADSLIGNNDRHGRNLGFIQNIKGLQLAPFYDNPSALGIEDIAFLGADLQPRGAIYTKLSDQPTLKDYVLEWNRLGFGKIIDNFKKNLSLEQTTKLITESHLTERRKSALLRLVIKRSEELYA